MGCSSSKSATTVVTSLSPTAAPKSQSALEGSSSSHDRILCTATGLPSSLSSPRLFAPTSASSPSSSSSSFVVTTTCALPSSLPPPTLHTLDEDVNSTSNDNNNDIIIQPPLVSSSPPIVHHHGRRLFRGIQNIGGGTACHTSTALQLLYHCFPIVTERLLIVAQIGYNLDYCYQQSSLTRVNPLSSTVKIRNDGESNGEEGEDANINDTNDDDGSSIIQREFVYQLAFFFHSLISSSNDATAVAIDPTDFYRYLSSSNNNAAAAINTDNVGDAAIVFRCLISMLEHSVQKEVQRLCYVVDMAEIQIETNEKKHELEEETEGGEVEIVRRLQQQLKTALDQTQLAMHESWSGQLVSRIVGTLATTTTTSSSISTTCTNNADDDSMAHANTTTTTTTTTVKQRIKKNGNIQRPLPIPLPLPVIFADNSKKNESNNTDKSNSSCYFPSLVNALHSITIEPNPIRGFDWSGLIERGEVINEETTNTFVTRLNADDGHEEIINVEKEYEKNMKMNDDEDYQLLLNAVRSENQDINKNNHLSSDCVSESTTDMVCNEQEVVYGNEDELQNDTTNDNSTSFIIAKDEHYAAAVMALKKTTQGTSNNRRGGDVIRRNSFMEHHHGKGSRNHLFNEEGRNESDMDTEVVLTGDDNKFMVHKESDVKMIPSSQGINSTNDTPNMNGDRLSLPAKCISSSEEDSSVDSQVSDVNTNSSDDTHSSAIETPSDIDNISLGSFTDDSVDSKEKNKIDVASHNHVEIMPINSHIIKENENDSQGIILLNSQVDPINGDKSSSSVDDDEDDEDSSSSSNSSNDTSSTETDSSSSSSLSGESSSSSYSTSSSSTGTNNAGDNNNDATDIVRDNSHQSTVVHNDWITRKETRFCLPLPNSLIFHLKRFNYSTVSGRVEKLSGVMDIPAVLDVRTCCCYTPITTTVDCPETNDYFRYHLSGAIVHVDPIDDDNDHATNFGELQEGHYVAFVRDWKKKKKNDDDDDPRWIEIDDESVIRIVDAPNGSSKRSSVPTDINSSCNAKEHRYATMVIYTREGVR